MLDCVESANQIKQCRFRYPNRAPLSCRLEVGLVLGGIRYRVRHAAEAVVIPN